jgi:uncharacterized protein Usg
MAEVAQSYEMVRNFNNFKAFVMFAVKKLEALLMLLGKIFFDQSPGFPFEMVLKINFWNRTLPYIKYKTMSPRSKGTFGLINLHKIP